VTLSNDTHLILGLGNHTIALANEARYDGKTYKKLPRGFPFVEELFSLVIVRFERFDQSVFWDQVITLGLKKVREVHVGIWRAIVQGEEASVTLLNDQTYKAISMSVNSVHEVDNNGKMVGIQGKTMDEQHKIDSFANATIRWIEEKDGKINGVGMKNLTMIATFPSETEMRMHVMLFKEKGKIKAGDDEFNVKRGSVKVSVEIMNWAFCGSVRNQTGQQELTDREKCSEKNKGEYLEMWLNFFTTDTVEGNLLTADSTGSLIRTASNDTIALATQARYDEADFIDLPSGYPLLQGHDTNQTVVIRFDRFESVVYYDPVITQGDMSTD
jgi:hypothetical protein